MVETLCFNSETLFLIRISPTRWAVQSKSILEWCLRHDLKYMHHWGRWYGTELPTPDTTVVLWFANCEMAQWFALSFQVD
jgi:hypothetical protein